MKTKIFLCLIVLIACSFLLSAQELQFKDISSEVAKPQKLKNWQVSIKERADDNFILSSVAPYRLFITDKNLNIIQNITLPEEYKKMDISYLCRLGNHHLVLIAKGYKKMQLGLLNEHFDLIKTYLLSPKWAFMRLICKDSNYAYLNVNGNTFIKVDENLNIIAQRDNVANLYSNNWTAHIEGDTLFLKLSNTLTLFDKNNFNTFSSVKFKYSSETNSPTNPSYHRIIYGKNKIAEFGTHRILQGWNYVDDFYAYLYDYNKQLQEFTVNSTYDKTEGTDQILDAVFDEHENLVLARVWRKWEKSDKERQYSNPYLTFTIISENGIETIDYGEFEKGLCTPIYLLKVENKEAVLCYGKQSEYKVIAIDMQRLTNRTLLTQTCNFEVANLKPTYTNKWENKSGYLLEFTQNIKLSNISGNQNTYYDMINTLIYINKDFTTTTQYRSKQYTGMTHFFFNDVKSDKKDNYFLLDHAEPHYSGKSRNYYHTDSQYYLINQQGQFRMLDLGSDVSLLPYQHNKYYVLKNYYKTNTYKLSHLEIR